MAKPLVEWAPKIEDSSIKILNAIKSSDGIYGVVDEKGRYLHWNEFKWRVPKGYDPKEVWAAVRLRRSLMSKYLSLADEKGGAFSFCIPNPIEAKLHQIATIGGGNVASVAGSIASSGVQEKYLVSSLIIEEAITSAQLEGAAVTREVAKKMIEEERSPVDENERMALNNYLLLRQALHARDEPLTLDLILDFHRTATLGTSENDNVPGEFRKSDDIEIGAEGEEYSAHIPPGYALVEDRMRALCDFANTDHSGASGEAFVHPVIKAIILHFMIGYEHPFRDGNGRTARALFYWFMLKSRYELFQYISISKLLKANPRKYGMSYLYTERDQNDLTYFIDFQLDVILKAFDELRLYLKRKSDEFNELVELLSNSELADKLKFVQKDLIKKGAKEPGRIFTAKGVASGYDISENTARTYLNKLVKLKLFMPAKDGRTTLYMAPSDLRDKLKP